MSRRWLLLAREPERWWYFVMWRGSVKQKLERMKLIVSLPEQLKKPRRGEKNYRGSSRRNRKVTTEKRIKKNRKLQQRFQALEKCVAQLSCHHHQLMHGSAPVFSHLDTRRTVSSCIKIATSVAAFQRGSKHQVGLKQ